MKISLKFVANGQLDDKSTLVQAMSWRLDLLTIAMTLCKWEYILYPQQSFGCSFHD